MKLVNLLMWVRARIDSLLEYFDRCHWCGEPALVTCESCLRRHCWEHESHMYSDIDCCKNCAEALKEVGCEEGDSYESQAPPCPTCHGTGELVVERGGQQ